MNRILCAVIAVSLIFSLGIPAFSASDYRGHWAEAVIDSLLSEKVISGDSEGIRPDDSITRSEFVTIINNVFSYTSEGATVNFPDVAADKWYFNHFLAAKKAGYLTGDNYGNANPERLITRAEAAVIICRIMKFAVADDTVSFSDDSDIPEWSRAAVYALSKEGIINGYPDGSFRAGSNMKRAEAFAIIYNVKNLNTPSTDKEEVSGDINITTEAMPSSGSSGGGGGGGGGGSAGGGSTGSVSQTFKITREDNENHIIAWSLISNASYTVKLTRESTGEYEEEKVSGASFSYKAMADRLTASDRKSRESFSVVVTAQLGTDVKTAAGTVYVDYPSVPEPDDVEVYSVIDNGAEKLYVSWSVSVLAASYDFKVDNGSGLSAVSYTVSDGKAIADVSFMLSDSLKNEYPYSIQGISGSSEVLSSAEKSGTLDKPLYYSGKGTEAEPYIIKNERHFVNIEKNNSAFFVLAEDIVLSDSYKPFVFNGSLKGDNTAKYRTVTVNITDATGPYTGLFTTSETDGTTVMYISLHGSVKGPGYTGGFFGNLTVAGNLSRCENYAAVESTGDRAGGFVGYSSKDSLSYLVNFGDVKTVSAAGGIAGYGYGGSYLANLGKIQGGWYVGGIFGVTYSSVNYSFNKGEVKGANCVGGIAGYGSGSNKRTEACYNAGNIIQTDASKAENQAGGIIGSIGISSSAAYALSSCYNVGAVSCADGSYNPIIPSYTTTYPSNILSASDCVYLSQSDEDDGKQGTVAVTEAELIGYSFASEILYTDESSSWPYPQIKNFPDRRIPQKLAAPAVVSIIADRTTTVLNISGSENTVEYEIYISDNSSFENASKLTATGGGSASLDIRRYLEDFAKYYIKIVSIGDGTDWLDSDPTETTHTRTPYRLVTPVLKGTPYFYDDNGTGLYKIEWESLGETAPSGYTVKITDSQSQEIYSEELTADAVSFDVGEAMGIVFGNIYNISIVANAQLQAESSEPLTVAVDTRYGGGKGTESEPWYICNEDHFKNIALNSSAHYILREDIELTNYSPLAEFGGTLSGLDNRVKNITVNLESDESNIGLFAQAEDATFKYIGLSGYVTATRNSTLYQTGGFVGRGYGTLTFIGCVNNADITAVKTKTGGFVGNAETVVLDNCTNNGDITITNGGNAGGFVGKATTVYNNSSVNTGAVSATSSYGDIVGSGTVIDGLPLAYADYPVVNYLRREAV